jgi:two-component system chemotaxis response regulator CheB
MDPIRVLVVDDSVLIRKILTEILSGAEGIEVVGSASDPIIARDKIKQLNPDVLTLDIEMPRMDGITFLKNLMRLRPIPTVMISTLTQKGANITLDALEIGAVDYIPKPSSNAEDLLNLAEELVDKVRAAAKAHVTPFDPATFSQLAKVTKLDSKIKVSDHVVAIGASTGGTEAIKALLTSLPSSMPPIVIAQHIPPKFSTSFAERMDRVSTLQVVEAQDGMKLRPGWVFIAPGDAHLRIQKRGDDLFCALDSSEKINRHIPSVEPLFDTVRETMGKNSVSVMLTGMGSDGAVAMKRMFDAGIQTLVQDEESSVVWGMPGSVVKLGGASQVLRLEDIPKQLMEALK